MANQNLWRAIKCERSEGAK